MCLCGNLNDFDLLSVYNWSMVKYWNARSLLFGFNVQSGNLQLLFRLNATAGTVSTSESLVLVLSLLLDTCSNSDRVANDHPTVLESSQWNGYNMLIRKIKVDDSANKEKTRSLSYHPQPPSPERTSWWV